MKLTIINGCNNENELQRKVLHELDVNNIRKIANWINLSSVKKCTGCDYCNTKNPGVCAISDGHNEVLRQYMNSDMVIIITPVEFGCCNSTIKNFIDRFQPLFLSSQITKDGKSLMKSRYDKFPKLTFVGVCENDNVDVAEAFKKFISTGSLLAASSKLSVKLVTQNTNITSLTDLICGEVL